MKEEKKKEGLMSMVMRHKSELAEIGVTIEGEVTFMVNDGSGVQRVVVEYVPGEEQRQPLMAEIDT